MPNIIMYSTDKIEFELLESFRSVGYIPVSYGIISNHWFVYGKYENISMPRNDGAILEGNKAYKYLINKTITSKKLLNLCYFFDKHIKNKNTDIEVKGVGGGSFIKYIDNAMTFIEQKNKKYFKDKHAQIFVC